jgi:hypothetical protein
VSGHNRSFFCGLWEGWLCNVSHLLDGYGNMILRCSHLQWYFWGNNGLYIAMARMSENFEITLERE